MRLEFAQLLEQHQAMVFSIALRFLRNRASAEELAQDVFLQLFKQLDRIDSPAHAAWWLRRATCHRSIDEVRRQKLRPHIALDSLPEPGCAAQPADAFLEERLRRLVDALPERARMVVVLRYQEDLDPSDIAELLRMPLSTVKSHLHRSLTVLRARLQPKEVCS